MHCCTFPHAPRLEPDVRLSPHPAQHLGSFLDVIQTIKQLLHFRSRLHARARVRRNITHPMYGIISWRIRVWLPHAPALPRLGAFAMGKIPRVSGFPGLRLLRPIRHSSQASGCRPGAPPSYCPPPFTSWEKLPVFSIEDSDGTIQVACSSPSPVRSLRLPSLWTLGRSGLPRSPLQPSWCAWVHTLTARI